MARVNTSDLGKYSTDSDWLKLQNDGDIARVQFLHHNVGELDNFCVHKIKTGENTYKYVDCKRAYGDPVDVCPMCAADIERKVVSVLSMYDHSDKKVKIWERSSNFIRKKIEPLFNRYGDLTKKVFEIERHGAKGDLKTEYEVIIMPDVEAVDVSEIQKPDVFGTFILNKSVEDMTEYVNTGSFPEAGNVQSESRRTVTRRGETY